MNPRDTAIIHALRACGGTLSWDDLATAAGLDAAGTRDRLNELRRCGFGLHTDADGVRLDTLPESLIPEAVAAFLDPSNPVGREIQVFRETASTNDLAMAGGARGAAHGGVVLAIRQTAGRGRLGRTWHSGPDDSLCLSTLLRPTLPPGQWPRLAIAAGLGVARAAGRLTGTPATLKWPNDVMLDGRKVAGILVESRIGSTGRFAVLGVGVNVNMTAFPPPIDGSATSLRLVTGRRYNLNHVAGLILRAIGDILPACEHDFDSLRREFLTMNELRGRVVVIRSDAGDLRGRPAGIDPEGGLILRDDAGRESVARHGEATVEKQR